jgi:hypothetical protein
MTMPVESGVPVDVRLSAYKVGSRENPRYVWGVGVHKEFLKTLPEEMKRAKLRQTNREVYLDLGPEGIKISSGSGRFAYAGQLGQHHLIGLQVPDEVARAIPIHGTFYPKKKTIKFGHDLPDIITHAFTDVEAFEHASDPKIHFPAQHFQEDVELALKEAPDEPISLPLNSEDDDDAEAWLADKIAESQEKIVTVAGELTPAIARAMLERNEGNRPIRKAKLNQYVSDIQAGRWQFNGETIIMSKDGVMNNGQHRAYAVVATEKSIPILFVFGVERESRRTVDTGAARGAHDHLAVEGFVQPTTLAALTRFVIAYENNDGRNFSNLNRVTSSEIFERAKSDPLLDKASLYPYHHANKSKRLAPPSVIGFCHYVFSQKDEKRAKEYLDQVILGINLGPTSPAYVVREKLLELSSLLREQKIEVLMRGWLAFKSNKPLKAIRIKWELPDL